MDRARLIDNLKVTHQRKRKDEMKRFEFFECDYCGRICEMPIEQYKSYTDDEILNAKYRCERCANILEKKKRGRPAKIKVDGFENAPKEVIKANPVILHEMNELDLRSIEKNMVNHPPHYTAGGIECIDAIMAAVSGLSPQEAVCVANVLKYTWRFKNKNGKQDLQKAGWYLNRLVDLQED